MGAAARREGRGTLTPGWTSPEGLRTFPARMISPADARQRVAEHLTGFPPAVVEAYLAFADTGDFARLDELVLGVLQFYLAKPPAEPLATLPGTTRLIEDLGVDSLTMIDVMFISEGLLGIKLADEELARLPTLEALREHFRRRMAKPDAHAA